eukprot:5470245-Pleurochrysis_carterae.AAC.2
MPCILPLLCAHITFPALHVQSAWRLRVAHLAESLRIAARFDGVFRVSACRTYARTHCTLLHARTVALPPAWRLAAILRLDTARLLPRAL